MTLGASALTMLPFQIAMAAAFPERNIKVYVPTREGGGADRNLRAVTSIWKKYLDTKFTATFYPGAAGGGFSPRFRLARSFGETDPRFCARRAKDGPPVAGPASSTAGGRATPESCWRGCG